MILLPPSCSVSLGSNHSNNSLESNSNANNIGQEIEMATPQCSVKAPNHSLIHPICSTISDDNTVQPRVAESNSNATHIS